MKYISIIGAGGHTRSSVNLLRQTYTDYVINVYDDSYNPEIKELIGGIELIGAIKDIKKDSLIFLSVGDNTKREVLFNTYKNCIIKSNLIHVTSFLEKNIEIGIANQVFAHVYINSFVKIGDNNIINTSAILEHEAKIGSHNHISVGTKLCGRTTVGNRCMIGAGAIIIDKVSICDDVIVGAGAVVTNNISEPGTYVGVPAKKIK